MWGNSAPKTGTTTQATKPSGFDMMVQTLLRNMGVTPDMLKGYIDHGTQLAQQFVGAVTGMNQRIAALEREALYHREILLRIAAATCSAPGVDELYPKETTDAKPAPGSEVLEWTGPKQS